MNSLPRAFVIERVFQAAFAGAITALGVGAELPAMVLAVAPLLWLVHTAAVVALALDMRRATGDTLLTGGQRIQASTLIWTARASLLEVGAYLVLLAGIAVSAVVGGQTTAAGLCGGAFVMQAFLFNIYRTQMRTRRLWQAIRDRRPEDAIAATKNADLSLPPRLMDANLVAEAWLMRGDGSAALDLLAPHLQDRGAAMRDAWIRLHRGETTPAAVLLDQKPGLNALDQIAQLALFATVAVSEERGAEVLPKQPEYEALWAKLPSDYGDASRLAFAAAAAQAGEAAIGATVIAGLGRPLSDHAYLAHTAPQFWRWVEVAAGRAQPPPAAALKPRPKAVDHVWAPPESDRPRGVAPISRLDGLQPVPGLPTGIRARRWVTVWRLVAVFLLIPILLSFLITIPGAIWSGDPVILALLALTLFLTTLSILGTVLRALDVWLRTYDPATGPVVVDKDGGRRSVSAARWMLRAQKVSQVISLLLISLAPLVSFGPRMPYAWLGILLSLAALGGFRPRTAALNLAMTAASGDGPALLQQAKALNTMRLVQANVRHHAKVYEAMAQMWLGDPAAANAAIPPATLAEVRWLRAWLGAETLDLPRLAHLLQDDTYGWWNRASHGFYWLSHGQPDELLKRQPEWLTAAHGIEGALGQLLRVQLVLAHVASGSGAAARDLAKAHALNPGDWAWVAKGWPKTGEIYAAWVG